MKKVVVTLLIVFTFAMSSTNVQAQAATPAIDLQCDGQVSFDVYPGANRTSMMNCTLSNPNNYNETIEMETSLSNDIHIDGFYATFPDGENYGRSLVVNLTAGEVKVISVKIVALGEMASDVYSITINATVTEANGVPPASVTKSSNNSLLNVNAYDNYDVIPEFAGWIFDVYPGVPMEYTFEMSVENNGNSLERLGIESISDLRDELESYNMVVGIPVVSFEVAPSETSLFNFSIGSISEINTSTWLELDNGTKQVTIDTNITIVNAQSGEDGYYCYECNGSTFLRIQINLPPSESQIDADEGSDSIPGFDGHLSMVSIILAAFVIARRPQY
jgi:hypothetical protein